MNRPGVPSRRVSSGSYLLAGLLSCAPAWAVSLVATGPAQPMPQPFTESVPLPVSVPSPEALAASGSASLVPLMAADWASHEISTVDATSAPVSGGATDDTIDDITFVARATESGRKEVKAAKDALPQLRDPSLKQLAEVLATHHDAASQRLSRIAEAKGWPVPGPKLEEPAPATGTASPDFDARWTADMIAGHERSVALYRAQAQAGEDKELRKYARETLPTIEQHLDWLRRLQK